MVNHRAQCTAELTVSFGIALLLLFGCFKTFLWFNERYVRRQVAYEVSRPTDRLLSPEGSVKKNFESELPKMDLFGEAKKSP